MRPVQCAQQLELQDGEDTSDMAQLRSIKTTCMPRENVLRGGLSDDRLAAHRGARRFDCVVYDRHLDVQFLTFGHPVLELLIEDGSL